MNPDELKAQFPNASPAFIRLNATEPAGQAPVQPGRAGTVGQLERDPGDGAVGEVQVQVPASGKVLVRITSVRKRLLDEDNACCKYHVDLLRYAGIILGDTPAQAKIEIIQEKSEPGAAEFVRIEVFEIR